MSGFKRYSKVLSVVFCPCSPQTGLSSWQINYLRITCAASAAAATTTTGRGRTCWCETTCQAEPRNAHQLNAMLRVSILPHSRTKILLLTDSFANMRLKIHTFFKRLNEQSNSDVVIHRFHYLTDSMYKLHLYITQLSSWVMHGCSLHAVKHIECLQITSVICKHPICQ